MAHKGGHKGFMVKGASHEAKHAHHKTKRRKAKGGKRKAKK
jgi:hypothetical protein